MENIERKIRLAGLTMKLVEYLKVELFRPKLNYRTVRTALTEDNGSDLHSEIRRLTPIFYEKEMASILVEEAA